MQQRLQHGSNETCHELPGIDLYIGLLRSESIVLSKTQKQVLKENSVLIWNYCNTLESNQTHLEAYNFVKIRAFAFLLLWTATQAKKIRNVQKLVETAVSAIKACLRVEFNDLAAHCLENQIPQLISYLKTDNTVLPKTVSETEAECHVLRVLLYWKDKRYDLADHWYEKMSEIKTDISDGLSESTSELLLEIGTDAVENATPEIALKWLGRSRMLIETKSNATFFHGSDLRLNILHRYGT